MINFRTRISHGVSHSPALFYLFLYSDASAGPAMVFPPLGSFDHVLSVSIDFPTNLKRDARFFA